MSESTDAPPEVLSTEHASSFDVVSKDAPIKDANPDVGGDAFEQAVQAAGQYDANCQPTNGDDAMGDKDADVAAERRHEFVDAAHDADAENLAATVSDNATDEDGNVAPLAPLEEAADVVLLDTNQDTAVAIIDDRTNLDTLVDVPLPNGSSPSSAAADWSPDFPKASGQGTGLSDEDQVETSLNVDAQSIADDAIPDADVDGDPDKSDTADLSDAELSDAEFSDEELFEELPYIADIAMVDTGESDEAQLSAATTRDDGEEATASGGRQSIDFGKVINAILGDTTEPPAVDDMATAPPIGAPKGPSHSFPRPPNGPVQATVKHVNNVPPSGKATAAAPGGGSGKASAKSPSAPPAAAGRRGQAARGNQGQSPAASRQANSAREKAAVDRAYQAFLNEEKIHVAENKWDAFPEGSRMFVGNLSQERVSKRDVFEQFHRYGRLAQISIKSAYGFVQYHSASEASAALKNLEGAEVRGRKIHLEVSRPPKKEKDNGRDNERGSDRTRGRGGSNRSPERIKSRGSRGGDRYDGRAEDSQRHSRDGKLSDSRGGHEPSNHQSTKQSRRSRDRSRSPQKYDRRGDDDRGYRSRRSPSPYGHSRHDSGRGGYDSSKSQHSGNVLDVQFLASQGLDWEFIKWVQGPFSERGLKTDVLYLTSHTPPRDSIIQMHVLGGITAIVDLDSRAQATGLIPVQVFNRSGGDKKVLFDGYRDLTPPVAADVVVRAKAAAVVQQHQPAYSQAYPSTSNTSKPYVPPYQLAAPAPAPVRNNTADLGTLFGQLDNNTLAQVLGALQTQHASAAAAAPPASYAQVPQASPYTAPVNTTQQAQLAALLSTLGATPSASAASYGTGASAAPYAAGLPIAAHAAAAFSSVPPGAEEQAVQAILAQFAQSRQ
ncbi:nuclear polyadenylated RNA-binding protein 3 [Sporothrix epigloea]|uniref:Nuclear polyadenylated RNA-binding protein 3 n=1 Tax=Sporothrix epigloea TaxID=1892477 RepID=A0ABP0DYY8_9PEZI